MELPAAPLRVTQTLVQQRPVSPQPSLAPVESRSSPVSRIASPELTGRLPVSPLELAEEHLAASPFSPQASLERAESRWSASCRAAHRFLVFRLAVRELAAAFQLAIDLRAEEQPELAAQEGPCFETLARSR
jgi:hypothetical protein